MVRQSILVSAAQERKETPRGGERPPFLHARAHILSGLRAVSTTRPTALPALLPAVNPK